MSTIRGHIHIGPDETLRIPLPGSAGKDVTYTIDVPDTTAKNGTNGVHTPSSRRRMNPEEWKAFVRETSGSMPNFPDLDRPGPNDYEKREEF